MATAVNAPRIVHATLPDGYRAAVRVWEPPRPIGRIVHVHGVISHGGWYLRSSAHLAASGFEVHFLDRRGSGLNFEARGDTPGHEQWLADVETYVESLEPGLPTLLFGMSWGGKLTAAVARHRPDLLAGIALLCPGLYARVDPTALQMTFLRLARATGLAGMRVTIPLQEPALFTDMAAWQDYIRTDPLTLRRATIRFLAADRALSRYATAAPEEITVPTLCVLAGADRITDNDRVRNFVAGLGGPTRIIDYQGSAHTIEFDPAAGRYFADLASWASDLLAGREGR